MSFRKRAEPLVGGRNPGARAPGIPGRTPPAVGRGPPGVGPVPLPVGRGGGENKDADSNGSDVLSKNPAIRPSSATSQPTVSTGCPDLDKILVHQGLPLGSSLIIEESGTTDFTAVLMRAFAAQAVMHNRIDKQTVHSHAIVVGMPNSWAKELPGEYKGSSREQKKQRVAANESKVSVDNMAEKDLKIAWRYGLKRKTEGEAPEEKEVSRDSGYVTQFDITQRLIPGAASHDMTFVAVGPLAQMVTQITRAVEYQLKQLAGRVVRIVVPAFLHPSVYPAQFCDPSFCVPLFAALTSVVTRFGQNVVLVASIASDLYPRDEYVAHVLEQLADGVVQLQPFNQEMTALLEKAYKDEPTKIQQGLVHVIKVPVFSAKGMMMERNGEYAFKNLRRRFEIDDWGIPVDDGEVEERPMEF